MNYVKEIYAPFTDEEISAKMVELLTPAGTQAKVEIVYQTLEGLHEACPDHEGDWYFSGDYPTPGGVKLVNQAFIDYVEQIYQSEKSREILTVNNRYRIFKVMRNVTLILDDGSRFHGKSFGYEKPVAGEVVFNTAMTGYLRA